jgi:signal transduction histidine kinase
MAGESTIRLRVLYAEDDPADADLTRRHFAGAAPDLQLDVVRTGGDCLNRALAGGYDVLLLDNRLPDMDGVDVLRELMARGSALPVVVATGAGDEELAVQVLRLGASDYVAKEPGYLERLPGTLRSAIERQRGQPPAGVARRSYRVLYIEHDAADVDLARRYFAAEAPHLTLEVASSSREALERVRQNGFDVVLADLRMPEMSALDLLHQAKSENLQLPWIVITSHGDERAAVASLKLGAYDYIVKRGDYLTHLPYVVENAIARFQLARANERLEAELVERQRIEAVLREQTTALAEAARQKDGFLAMLGHELRNPLAPIRTALELLRHPRKDEISRSAHDVMARQILHMARLLDDLLDVARITSGRITLNVESLDLRRVVGDAIESVRALIQARRHRLETAMPPHPVQVRGDQTRLVQVVVNLLNNAAKYTDEGGTIRVSVAEEGSNAVIRVADNGMGIPARLLPKIFDLFTQDERSLDRAPGGLGLGLTLVRRITELHHGTVEARSEGRGRGSEFIVTLPLQPADEQDSQEAKPTIGCQRSLRCLVVEDNVDAAHMLEIALGLEGHNVRVALDGPEAVELASQFHPEAVVLDIGLPRMNGYEVARAIRQLPGLDDVLIIALTGYGQAMDYQRSREAGIDAFLVKPVDLDTLLEALAAGRPSRSR